MSYIDPQLFDSATSAYYDDIVVGAVDLDATPKAAHDRSGRLRHASAAASGALPGYDPDSPFNSPNPLGDARHAGAKQSSAYLTSPLGRSTGALGTLANGFGTPRQQVHIVDDYSIAGVGHHYDGNAYLGDAPYISTTLGLGVALPEPDESGLPPVNYASMRLYGVPHDKTGGKGALQQRTGGHYLPYPPSLVQATTTQQTRKENLAPSPLIEQTVSPRLRPISPPVGLAAAVPTVSHAPRGAPQRPAAARNRKNLAVRTQPVTYADQSHQHHHLVQQQQQQPIASDASRSPKRIKSMPTMRDPRTPPTQHPPLPSHQPAVPYNSPDIYATPLQQQQAMPFSFSELFEMGLAEGSNLDLGGYEGPKSPSAFSFGLDSGLSSASSATFDFGLALPDEPSLLPTPNLAPSSVLSTPSTAGCRSPNLNPFDTLYGTNVHYSQPHQVPQVHLQSPHMPHPQSPYDVLLSPHLQMGHAIVPSMGEETQWSMPTQSSHIYQGSFQSLDHILAGTAVRHTAPQPLPRQQARPNPPMPPKRAQRAVSRKRSRADFLSDQDDEEDEDEDSNYGGGEADDDDFILSSEDIEIGDQESEDGAYTPGSWAPPSPPPRGGRRQFVVQPVHGSDFNYADPRPKPTRVFSAPVGRLRPGPKPKRSIPNLSVLQPGGGPDMTAVQQALVNVGADPNLIYQKDESDADGDDEPYQGTLSRAVIRALYTTVGGQGQKRYKCLMADCDRSFPRKSAIESHIQTHLEDKPFVCEIDGCGAAFVRQHDLRRHARIHSGRKPFSCPCGKGFARGDALMRHRQRGICEGSVVPRRG